MSNSGGGRRAATTERKSSKRTRPQKRTVEPYSAEWVLDNTLPLRFYEQLKDAMEPAALAGKKVALYPMGAGSAMGPAFSVFEAKTLVAIEPGIDGYYSEKTRGHPRKPDISLFKGDLRKYLSSTKEAPDVLIWEPLWDTVAPAPSKGLTISPNAYSALLDDCRTIAKGPFKKIVMVLPEWSDWKMYSTLITSSKRYRNGPMSQTDRAIAMVFDADLAKLAPPPAPSAPSTASAASATTAAAAATANK